MSQGLSKTRAEVKDLQRLRQLFLEAPAREGLADYWADEALLALYDSTYARRIGWKWDAVLTELAKRGWHPPAAVRRWVDWGCGSGIAGETFLSHMTGYFPETIVFSDRSPKARQFAADKIARRAPSSLNINHESPEFLKVSGQDLILISHVLTELKNEQVKDLLTHIQQAGSLIWVEPGTPYCSKKLSEIRDELLKTFDIIAPCPHMSSCPLGGNSGDWCHFFAQPPSYVFQDPFWAAFSKEFNIDLRSLPVSFLVLQRKIFNQSAGHKADRIIARPRFYKGFAKVMLCTADGRAETRQLQQRAHKNEFKSWEKDCFYAELTNVQDCD
jgi:ribosomal protein RSM22 (predicted rRNA methylase)